MGVCTKDPVSAGSLATIAEHELDDRDSILQLCDVVVDASAQLPDPPKPCDSQGHGITPPHLAKAQEMTRHAEQMARLQQGLAAAINRLSLGVCILDQAGHVVDMNQEFERQVQDYDAFRLGPDGKLDFVSARDRVGLTSLMLGEADQRLHKEVMPVPHGAETGALRIDIEVLQRTDDGGAMLSDGAIIYSMDTSLMADISVDPLAQTYDLTPTEAKLTKMVCEGLTNAQIAQIRGRAVDTINAQVKSVLAKTGCTNRTQLVRMMTSFGTDFLVR